MPLSQPLEWKKAQGLQEPAAWPAEPMLGISSEPRAGRAGGGGGTACAGVVAKRGMGVVVKQKGLDAYLGKLLLSKPIAGPARLPCAVLVELRPHSPGGGGAA